MIAVISPACLRLWEQLASGRAAHVAALSSTPTAGRLQQAVILLFFFLLPTNKASFFLDFSGRVGQGRDVFE